jgi:ammonium transporter Rh
LVVTPGIAIVIGSGAGIMSALGYAYLLKCLQKHTKLHDTCGVLNLHGMPGILGGLIGAIVSS